MVTRLHAVCAALLLLSACGGGSGALTTPPPAPPAPVTIPSLDLGVLPLGQGFVRLSGAASSGRFGVPVAAGFDCDNDGNADYAMSAMLASPFGRSMAGQVYLVFGNGLIEQSFDTAVDHPDILVIAGVGPNEVTGSEIWMDDVTGDGIGDLLIGRQNYREPVSGRIGAGALTIVVGSSSLRDLAARNEVLDLAAPPASVGVVTFVGAVALDRLGIWMRTGDVTGDGINDLVVGADQEDLGAEVNRGAAYLIRGGAHLAAAQIIDLANFGSTAVAGHIMKIEPPAGSSNYHFAATIALADLDNNGRSEILIAASLKRVGAEIQADGAPDGSAVGIGGNPGGSAFIVWDDNISSEALWPAGQVISLESPLASITRIDGGAVAGVFSNHSFAEEMMGGLDYNADGAADVFFGDIWGNVGANNRVRGGVGHLFFSAAALKGREFSMDAVPGDLNVTTILGPIAGAISSDTSLQGDFDGDGIADLAIASPLAAPFGRTHAGTVHVFWGRAGSWPTVVDLEQGSRPSGDVVPVSEIHGGNGETSANDRGDTLMYSAASADMDGDGRTDLIINEMRGNGIAPTALDVGNLLIISGATLPKN